MILLTKFTTDKYPENYVPTIFENYTYRTDYKNKTINIEICDTITSTSSKLREMTYHSTDVCVFLFSLVNLSSLENIQGTLFPEFRSFCPNAAFILVGLQREIRDNFAEHVEQYRREGMEPVSTQQGEAMATRLGASAYIECSVRENYNVKEVFETAIAAVMEPTQRQTTIACFRKGVFSASSKSMDLMWAGVGDLFFDFSSWNLADKFQGFTTKSDLKGYFRYPLDVMPTHCRPGGVPVIVGQSSITIIHKQFCSETLDFEGLTACSTKSHNFAINNKHELCQLFFGKPFQICMKSCVDIAAGDDICYVVNDTGKLFAIGQSDYALFGSRPFSQTAFHLVDLPHMNVTRVFAGGNNCFIVTDKNRLMGCGENAHGELGFQNKTIVPFFTDIPGDWSDGIADIVTQNGCTFIVTKSGAVFSAGEDVVYPLLRKKSPLFANCTDLASMPVKTICLGKRSVYAVPKDSSFMMWAPILIPKMPVPITPYIRTPLPTTPPTASNIAAQEAMKRALEQRRRKKENDQQVKAITTTTVVLNEVPKSPRTKDINDMIMDYRTLQTIRSLGHGGQGTVFEMSDSLNTHYAVKLIDLQNNESTKHFVSEFESGAKLIHPCIVQTAGFFMPSDGGKGAIIMELLDQSLDQLIAKVASGEATLTDEERNIIILGIVLGMRWIHGVGLMHRDLKPSNIMLSRRKEARIGDLGMSRATDAESNMTKGIGTLRYMAPEISDGAYDSKVDVFSFGLIVIELFTLKPPFAELTELNAYFQYKNGIVPAIPSYLPDGDLISRCLSLEPSTRPSFEQIAQALCSKLQPTGYSFVSRIAGIEKQFESH